MTIQLLLEEWALPIAESDRGGHDLTSMHKGRNVKNRTPPAAGKP
jgi:hypothetical protein